MRTTAGTATTPTTSPATNFPIPVLRSIRPPQFYGLLQSRGSLAFLAFQNSLRSAILGARQYHACERRSAEFLRALNDRKISQDARLQLFACAWEESANFCAGNFQAEEQISIR